MVEIKKELSVGTFKAIKNENINSQRPLEVIRRMRNKEFNTNLLQLYSIIFIEVTSFRF